MKLTVAYDFAKKIILEGKAKDFSTSNVKEVLFQFLSNLKEHAYLSMTDYNVLQTLALYVDDIFNDKLSVDEAFVNALSAVERATVVEKNLNNRGVVSDTNISHSSYPVESSCSSAMSSCGSPAFIKENSASESPSDNNLTNSTELYSSCGSSRGTRHC